MAIANTTYHFDPLLPAASILQLQEVANYLATSVQAPVPVQSLPILF